MANNRDNPRGDGREGDEIEDRIILKHVTTERDSIWKLCPPLLLSLLNYHSKQNLVCFIERDTFIVEIRFELVGKCCACIYERMSIHASHYNIGEIKPITQ